MSKDLKLRPIERSDLQFIHQLHNDSSIMSYWFEEPYETFATLQELYDKQNHKQNGRHFIVEKNHEMVGIVELVGIDFIHRNAEFQIIIDPEQQGNGYATAATELAMDYSFSILNLHKLYLIVDAKNEKAIHIYKKVGFSIEGELQDEFFVEGSYHNAIRMCMFQHQFYKK